MTEFAGPKGHWFWGNLADFRADRLGFFVNCAKKYGDVVSLRLPGKRMLLLNRPDLIEQVLVTQSKNFIKHFGLRMYKAVLGNGLVTSEGELWRNQRKLAAPAFSGSQVAEYSGEMVSAAQRMCERWGNESRVRDVHAEMMELTLGIACRTLFGADACPDPKLVGESMQDALRSVDVRFSRPFPLPDWLPTPANLRLRRAMRTMDGVVRAIIDRKRGSDGETNLLSMLLRARDESGSAMNEAQLLDQVRTILLAGHETTALALAYAIYLLAKHPEAQEKLREELADVLNGRPARYEDLERLRFLRQVVMEMLRLYPPADVLGREAVCDCDLNGVRVPRGMTVFMSQWVMHHDDRYFLHPWSFRPDRWTDEFEKSLPRFAYFPFGGGPRYCVGQAFAMAEASLVLATLCRRFSFEPDRDFKLELWPSITLRPRAGVKVRVKPHEITRIGDR